MRLGLCTKTNANLLCYFTRGWLQLVSYHNLNTQEAVMQIKSINYDLLSKSSFGTCFNKLITNIRQPKAINYDCKTVSEKT